MQGNDWPGFREAVLCVGIVDTEARPDDRWLVQVSSDDMRTMMLHELDEALKSGVIGEHTLVLREGTFQWTELGLLAASKL